MNIDGTNKILGRIVTLAAKRALLGESVTIINCEKIVISGNTFTTISRVTEKRGFGNKYNGPFISRSPEKYVKRVVRGMLPCKYPRGRAALKRVMCYKGVPAQLQDVPVTELQGSDIHTLGTLRYITIQKLCATMGGKA